MAVQQSSIQRLKAAYSVSEMAKMCALSRARFYELVGRGIFVQPIYSVSTKRPFFTDVMAEKNLAAKETGIGCNGEYVLFYQRKIPSEPTAKQKQQPALISPQQRQSLVDGLKSLGVISASSSQIDAAITSCFPSGVSGTDETELLRAIYRYLKRQGSA